MSGFLIGPCGVAPAASASWTPASVTTAFWYDASNAGSLSTTVNGASVSSWNDLSGNARHLAQATSANQPLYTTGTLNSLPGIHFQNPSNSTTSSSQMATAVFTLAQPFTLMAVIKNGASAIGAVGGNGTFAILLDGDIAGAAANRYVLFNTRNEFSGDAGYYAGTATIDAGVLLAANTGYHMMNVANGSSSSSDINGTTTTAQNPGTFGVVNGISIGSLTGTVGIIDCYVCEVFCIPDTTHTANALAYVSAKWGV